MEFLAWFGIELPANLPVGTEALLNALPYVLGAAVLLSIFGMFAFGSREDEEEAEGKDPLSLEIEAIRKLQRTKVWSIK